MKKFAIILLVGVLLTLLVATLWSRTKSNNTTQDSPTPITSQNTRAQESPPSENVQIGTLVTPQATSGTASFAIYTNNTFRIFSATMYHLQASDVYISPENPNLVHFSQPTTWQEFFDTLPFSVSETCLTTGTGQKFCNTDSEKLFFYLNGEETANALDQIIKPEDSLLITYGNPERIDLDAQLLKASFSNTAQPDN